MNISRVSICVLLWWISHLSHAVTLNPGDIIVSEHSGAIVHVDPVSGAQTVISSGGVFASPHTSVLDTNGDLIVADPQGAGGTGSVIRIDPASGSQQVVSSGGFFSDPAGLVIDASGNYIVTDRRYGGTGAVLRVDPASGAQTIVSSGGNFQFPIGITADDAGDFVVADFALLAVGAIIKVNAASGAQSTLFSGGQLANPLAVALDENGDYLVVDSSGSPGSRIGVILRITPTGAQTVVSTGGYLSFPQGIALENDGSILVADGTFSPGGALIRIDPSTGDQTLLSTGGNFEEPIAITVVPTEVSDPSAAIAEIIDQVMNLNLQQGISNSLDAKLDSALNALDDSNNNNDGAALNSMYAFCNSVEAQRGKKIPDAAADALIAAANGAIAALDENAMPCQ